jgi:hypothetical protein
MDKVFRTDPRTGLQYHSDAEKLIKANAVAGVVFLLLGGVLALLVSLTRWPAVHLLNAEWFYLTLTAHGLDMLIFWILFFEVAILYFCASTLLRCRLATPRLAWLAFALMLIGAITTNVAIFQGESSVMMTSYVPMQAKPPFYLGLILFAVGGLIATFIFLGTLVIAKAENTYEGSIPLVTFGALTACIIAIFTIASGAIILIPTFLWSRHLVGNGALLTADQRRRPCFRMVRGRSDCLWREADVGKGEPCGIFALHPFSAAGMRAPLAFRSWTVLGMEDRQRQLLYVLRCHGQHDPRIDGAGFHGNRAT